MCEIVDINEALELKAEEDEQWVRDCTTFRQMRWVHDLAVWSWSTRFSVQDPWIKIAAVRIPEDHPLYGNVDVQVPCLGGVCDAMIDEEGRQFFIFADDCYRFGNARFREGIDDVARTLATWPRTVRRGNLSWIVG